MTWRNAFAVMALMTSFCVPGILPAQKPINRIPKKALAEPANRPSDEQALRLASEAYSEAVNRSDLTAIMDQWTLNGEYRNNLGITLEGRPAIEATYKKWLVDHPQAKLKVVVDRIRLLSKEAAWVEGTLHLELADGIKSRSRFRTLRLREEGVWRISESTETLQTGSELEDLAWLKGRWKGKAGEDEAEFFVEPTLGGAFLKVHFTRRTKGKISQQGFHMVGSDPRGQGLVSSIFEASSATGNGHWLFDGHHWEVEITGIDSAGLEATAIQVITQNSADSMTWQAIERVVGGVKLSDTVPLKLTKSK